jgi:hypothetical protein
LAKTFHQFFEKECRFKVETHLVAPFKIIRIEPKTDESKVYLNYKERTNDEGFVMNLSLLAE